MYSRPLSAPTNAAIGACMPAPSWASICSRDGIEASLVTCALSIALPSNTPPFTAGFWSFSLAKSVMHLGGGDRILGDDESRRAAQTLADQATLVHGAERERVLDDDVLDVRLAQAATQFRHPLHVESREVGVVERRGALRFCL